MAVTAKFQADFSSFIAAIDKAEVALVDFGKGAGKVESSLNRMVDNFSGRKLIQEASLMTIAIEKSGGVANLTAKELERVGAVANDAAEKMKKLGYDVPAGLQKLADETKRSTGNFENMKSVVSSLASVFGVAFSIGAVVNFGKALLADADALTKLHDKTGVSLQGLQKFQIAGDDAGNSIDELTSAITKMEDKLVSGDSSALSALSKLGLSFEDIKGLTPENQFIAISDALRKVQDPAQQVNIAIDLFGKTGANVLPTLKRGFDDLKGSIVGMSDETVKAFDEAGDAIARWWRITKGATAEAVVGLVHLAEAGFNLNTLAMNDMAREGEVIIKQLEKMTTAAAVAAPKIAAIAPPGLPRDLDAIERSLNQGVNDALKKAADAAKKAMDAILAFQGSVRGLSFKTFVDDTSRLNAQVPDLTGHMADMASRFADVREHMDDLESSTNEFHDGITLAGDEIATVTIPMFAKLATGAAQNTKAFDDLGKKAKDSVDVLGSLDRVLSNVNNKFVEVAAVGVRAASEISKVAKASSEAGEGFTKGDWLKVALIGVSALATAFGKLFGNNEEKKINPVREAFVQAAGGLAELNARAAEAGVTLTALLNAKNPEAYTKAINELNAAFQFQDDAMKTLDDTAAKYGITLSEMGPKYRQGKLDEQFLQLFQDQKVLAAGGVDFDLILQKQAGSFQDLIDAALETGATIPESLRGAVERMIELGLLTDDSGEKLTDIGKLNFAETLDKKFSTLIDTINKLADAITRGLGGAIAAIPDKTIHIGFQVDAPPDFAAQSFAGGGVVAAPQYAAMGRVIGFPGRAKGTDIAPAWLTPGERVLSLKETAAYNSGAASGGGGGDNSAVLQEMADLRRQLPKLLRDAVQLAPRQAA